MDPSVAHALQYPYTGVQAPTRIEDDIATPYTVAPEDIAGRHAVLAVGSNASAEVMAGKMARTQRSGPFYITPVLVLDHDVVYSAHVSASGSIPATLWPSRGTTAWLAITWLNDEQLAGVDQTEPNYERLEIPSAKLRGNPHPQRVETYVSRHGALSIDGSPVAVAEVKAKRRTLPSMTQTAIQGHYADGTIPEFIAANIADPAARQQTITRLREHALEWRP